MSGLNLEDDKDPAAHRGLLLCLISQSLEKLAHTPRLPNKDTGTNHESVCKHFSHVFLSFSLDVVIVHEGATLW